MPGRLPAPDSHCVQSTDLARCEVHALQSMPVASAQRTRRVNLAKKMYTLFDLCVSSLRRGHANLLCIVPLLTGDPRRESSMKMWRAEARPVAACRSFRRHCVCSRSGRPPSPFPLQLPLARVDLPPKFAGIIGFCD